MRVLLCGFGGYMGKEVQKTARKPENHMEIVGGIDACFEGEAQVPVARSFDEARKLFPAGCADCIIDFSHHSAACGLLAFAADGGFPIVVATTGHTPEELEAIRAASEKIPVFFSANMSVGIALLVKLAKITAAAMPGAEIEIIEKHHDRKLDAPSGTAVMLAKELMTVRPDSRIVEGRSGHGKREFNDIGIHAIRMGNIVGEHEVIFGTANQTVTLKHEAHDRALFADGAATAAAFLVGKPAGLYDMHSLLAD